MPDYRYIEGKLIEGYSFSRHIFQMDILEIEVSNEEIKEFEQNEKLFGRKLWKKYNKCEVEGCQNLGRFTTFRQYINHWRNIHDRFIKLFKCTSCGKRFTNDKTAKIHIKSHKLAILEIMDQENKYFKDPGGCLPYLSGSPYDRLNILEEDKVKIKIKQRENEKLMINTKMHFFLSKKKIGWIQQMVFRSRILKNMSTM